MAAIPANLMADPTLAAIDAALVREKAQEPRRTYLGFSAIGQSCSRRLWYSFRWAENETFSPLSAKAIEDGHRGEDVQADRLRLVPGVELHTVAEDGKQFGFIALAGHFRGHMDGAIHGVLQAPKTWHVWEHKQVNEKKFAKLDACKAKHGEKDALRHWDPVYYAQAVLYMRFTGMTRHYLTCASPGGRSTTSCRTDENTAEADRLVDKAERIIFTDRPPERITDDPAWFECKWCPYSSLCHATAAPLPNCRTCAHATPARDGTWVCERHHKVLSKDDQLAGCQAHRFIPALLDRFAEPIDANEDDNWIAYRNTITGESFVNGADGLSSESIHDTLDKRLLGAKENAA